MSVVVSTNNTANIEVLNGTLILNISSDFEAPHMVKLSVMNVNSAIPSPANYIKLFEFYLGATPGTNVTINVTERYNCGIKSQLLAPFYISNNTWVPIYNSFALQSTCTITFSAQNNHVIGLFEYSSNGKKSASKPTPLEYATLATLIVVIAGLAAYAAYLLVSGRK